MKRGDVLLLCSDGLTDALSDAVIAEALLAGDDATAIIQRAIALERDDQDNVTCVVLRV